MHMRITSSFNANNFTKIIAVVKLFNAVTKHQKEVDSKLKKATTEVKKDKGIFSLLFC